MNPTPTVHQRERMGGRWQEVLGAAANLAREAQPVFVVSREDLKVAGVFNDPTTDDTFQELDSAGSPTGATFYVQQTTPVGFLPGGFLLLVRAKFHDAPGG